MARHRSSARTDRRAALTALTAVVAVVASFLAIAGGLFAPSSATAKGAIVKVFHPKATVTRTIHATATATATTTVTATTTATVAGPTQTVTANPTTLSSTTAPAVGPTTSVTSSAPSAPVTSFTPAPTATSSQSTTAEKLIGMSAPSSLWSTRISEVGAKGVKARRIFADLTSTGRDQSAVIDQAVAAGMLPVVSYKVPSVATMNAGGYNAWLDAVNSYLGGLGVPVVASYWHEPNGDMSGAEFQTGSQIFLNHVTAKNISVGPILNGWLLDSKVSTFASFTSPSLLSQWDFVAVDSYQAGTVDAPNAAKYGGRAVPLLATWLKAQGHPDMPIGVGEYNGYTADSLAKGGQAILSTPQVWFGLVWNSEGGLGHVLTGDRLTAYQSTKADPRALN